MASFTFFRGHKCIRITENGSVKIVSTAFYSYSINMASVPRLYQWHSVQLWSGNLLIEINLACSKNNPWKQGLKTSIKLS